MNNEELKRWDEWFVVVGGDYLKQWETVKNTLPRQAWLNWASIIELNRISTATPEKEVNRASITTDA